MREQLQPNQRIRAIQDELAGFLLKEVIDDKGEHYVEENDY